MIHRFLMVILFILMIIVLIIWTIMNIIIHPLWWIITSRSALYWDGLEKIGRPMEIYKDWYETNTIK